MTDPPKFGDWESNAQYTQVFQIVGDKHRDGGKSVNSNDPLRVQALKTKDGSVAGRDRNTRSTDYPEHHKGTSSKARIPSASECQRRVQIPSVGSDRSLENSPLNPRIAEKVGLRSPSKQRGNLKQRNHCATTTPETLKSKPSNGIASEKGVTIPSIGDWDPEDPEGDKITGVFKRLKDEKAENSPKVPSLETWPTHNHRDGSKTYRPKSSKCWCFPWSRK